MIKHKIKLSAQERLFLLYALRSLISAFPSKEEFNPEDWPIEQKEQRGIRRLLKRLEATHEA